MLAGFLLIQVLGGLTDFPHFAGPQTGFAGCLLPMDGNSGWKYKRAEICDPKVRWDPLHLHSAIREGLLPESFGVKCSFANPHLYLQISDLTASRSSARVAPGLQR